MKKIILLFVFVNISLFAQAPITASGAGNGGVNGNYSYVSSYGGKNYYQHDVYPSIFIVWGITRPNQWQIYDSSGPYDLYFNTQDTELPPADGWQIGADGVPNAPTLSGGVLPVELVSFEVNVNENQVKLNWQTATEVNNYGFEIEKKFTELIKVNDASTGSASDWEKIAFVAGTGNSNSPKEYSFVDNSKLNGNYQYRLKQIDIDGNYKYSNIVEVNINSELPTKFELSQNYPNPFNPATVIRYSLPSVAALSNVEAQHITLKIYDILGNELTTLVNENQSAGNYEVTFNASGLASGMYFYRLNVGNGFNSTKKMILLK